MFKISDSLLLQQIMLTYSLISATVPNLKSFMKSFSTGLGVSFGFLDKDLEASSEAYALQPLTTHSGRRRTRSPEDLPPDHTYGGTHELAVAQQPILRPGSVQHEVIIHHSPDGGSDHGSSATEDTRGISRCGSRDSKPLSHTFLSFPKRYICCIRSLFQCLPESPFCGGNF